MSASSRINVLIFKIFGKKPQGEPTAAPLANPSRPLVNLEREHKSKNPQVYADCCGREIFSLVLTKRQTTNGTYCIVWRFRQLGDFSLRFLFRSKSNAEAEQGSFAYAKQIILIAGNGSYIIVGRDKFFFCFLLVFLRVSIASVILLNSSKYIFL